MSDASDAIGTLRTPTSESTIADHRGEAYCAIEQDLGILESAAGVLHMLYVNLQSREGSRALANSVWFTACGIEGAVARIRSTLEHRSSGGARPAGGDLGHVTRGPV
jgi:hypothetical protein